MNIFLKALFLFKKNGIFFLLKKILFYPLEIYRNYRLRIALKKSVNCEDYFTQVYFDSVTRKLESLSGVGSSLAQTSNVRKFLPYILEVYKVRSILDMPCGDLNWMREILNNFYGTYTGIDIVRPLITKLSVEFSQHSKRIEFIHGNALDIQLPDVDLLICRDFMFHLSLSDTFNLLSNIQKCNFRYFLATSHETDKKFVNRDIKTGGFRKINLFLPPYNFSRDFIFKIEDFSPPEPVRHLVLWEKSSMYANPRGTGRFSSN